MDAGQDLIPKYRHRHGAGMSAVAIYILCEPITSETRYVGKATDPQRRYLQHVQQGQLSRNLSRKNSWIKSLLAAGTMPELQTLEVVPAEEADQAERDWIECYRRRVGDRLTNGTAGGDGGAVTDPAARERIAAAHRGTKASAETRAAMSVSAKKRAANPVERERLLSISNGTPPVHHGEKNHNAKLTEGQVLEIRRLYEEGVSRKELAVAFGITPVNVWLITTYRAWKHLP